MQTFDSSTSGHYRARPFDGLQGVLANYDPAKTASSGWFGTFCLETDEYFSQNGVYNATLSQQAFRGGSNTDGGDTLSRGTAFLYETFATGGLDSLAVGFSYHSVVSASALQNVIWALEDESMGSMTLSYETLLISQFGSLANAKMDYTGANVRVMNLTSGEGVYNQDQLVLVSVPEGGGTLALLGLAITGVEVLRRRGRQQWA